MKKIEEYVENIYRSFDEKDEETKIIKEETITHLMDEVEDLKKSGLSEEKSINKALSNFGNEKIVINELKLILKKQDKFSKILKISAIAFFMIASVFFTIYVADDFSHRNDSNPYLSDKNTKAYVFEVIKDKIKDKNEINSELNNEITNLLDEFNIKNDNGIYDIKISKGDSYNIVYEYKKDVTDEMIPNGNGGASGVYSDEGTHTWDIFYKRTDKQQNYDYDVQQKAWNERVNRIPNRLGQISNYLFVISGVLIFIYVINKLYMKGSFSVIKPLKSN